MKPSKSLIAAAVVALLPLAAVAGDDKDKMGSKQGHGNFDMLDTNRDGRISRTEAASDSKLVFSTADKNGDGYLDTTEYSHRDGSKDSSTNSVPSSQSPESASPNSDGASSKTDPNMPQGTQPSGARERDAETPRQ